MHQDAEGETMSKGRVSEFPQRNVRNILDILKFGIHVLLLARERALLRRGLG